LPVLDASDTGRNKPVDGVKSPNADIVTSAILFKRVLVEVRFHGILCRLQSRFFSVVSASVFCRK